MGYSRQQREQHAREAEELSAELGGTDKDVKAYFFGLSRKELAPILDEYERLYTWKARNYAEDTIPRWRSGERRMSGMVAARLYRLLPPTMPLEKKYELVKNLWTHVGPHSSKRVRVGRGARLEDVLEIVRIHMGNVVRHYMIPAELNRRFNWLTANDVQLRQLLLNRLLDEEPRMVLEGIRAKFPVLERHMSGAGGAYTRRLNERIRIGNHIIELVFDNTIEGVRAESAERSRVPDSADGPSAAAWAWAACGVVAVLAFLALLISLG